MSASAGKLVITEPHGSTAPRFAGDSKISAYTNVGIKGSTFGLVCPAQSYPPAKFK
ncbi:unnamed protein product [Orchesella dallaii]|uniref:Uncharacterized protein n=1 Tax=Orchesella dallaii TaxID=48710 RepID=A0ABP1QTI6_9HEXA